MERVPEREDGFAQGGGRLGEERVRVREELAVGARLQRGTYSITLTGGPARARLVPPR
jgi:hypothetical protein